MTDIVKLGTMGKICIAAVVQQGLHKLSGGPVFVAGGYLRDAFTCKPYKDIDIWMPYYASGDVEKLIDALAEPGSVNIMSDYGDVDRRTNLMDVYEFKLRGIPFNVVMLDVDGYMTIEKLLEVFDFGICQIAAGLDGIVYGTQAFTNDLANRTFTMLHHTTPKPVLVTEGNEFQFNVEPDNQYARSLARFKRLTADRYKGWTLKHKEG